MRVFKKIGAISSLVIYLLTIGLTHTAQFYIANQETGSEGWYKVDDLKDHFNHTVPVKFSVAMQVKPSPQPYPTDETQLWTFHQTYSFYFNRLFNRLSSDLLNLLIEQKKVNLLYSFHFFL